ncbi:MAG: hypothetical protein GX130_06550 [Candidatus Hydrogenedens sp.]|jgi:hypothetical protein|nr:hypothetical protein [Candidatus Hydrogenedens sp.]
MKTWKLTIAMLVVALVATAAFNATADDKGVAVTVTGDCVNLLKAVGGDNAPEGDSTFGALNVLQVKEIADADGNAVEGVKVLHILPTASASELLSADGGKTVTVKGLLFKECLTLQVNEVTGDAGDADGADDFDDWDEIGITTMSQQAII